MRRALLILLLVAVIAHCGEVARSTEVRITVDRGVGGRVYGSGTVIARDERGALVLTCAHLFADRGDSSISVCAGRQGCAQGELVRIDKLHDLAGLRIGPLAVPAAVIAATPPRPGDSLRACGFGRDGRLAAVRGRALGYARAGASTTYETLMMTGDVRDGDSGGPIYNEAGELVAVLWGTDGKCTAGTCCTRIRTFLRGLMGRGVPSLPQPPSAGPAAPMVPITPAPPFASPPSTPSSPIGPAAPPVPSPSMPTEVDAILARLQLLEQALSGDTLQDTIRAEVKPLLGPIRDDLGALAGLPDRMTALAGRPTVGPDDVRSLIAEAIRSGGGLTTVWDLLGPVCVALGWSSPPSAAVLSVVWLALRLLRRRRQATGGEEDSAAPAEGHFPGVAALPRDGSEASEILRLSATEGRDPLLDALVGRLTSDRLDNLVDAGGPAANWAADLRRELLERVNQIMPVALSVGRGSS